MSVKLELYQAVKARLQTITSLKNVLHYNGQDLNDFEKEKPKRFPQAWIQLTTIPWQPSEQRPNNLNRTQQQKSDPITLTIYTATFNLSDDDDIFETDLVLIDEVYRALSMLEGLNFGPLQRLTESDLSNNNNVRIWAQEYTCMVTECAIEETDVDAAPVTLVINKKVQETTFLSTDTPDGDYVPQETDTIGLP